MSGFHEKDGEKTMHHGGSMHNYMALKNAKLREQFEANMFQTPQGSDLFQGVIIFVNGHTSPSALELKQIMMAHGGRLENYLTRKITHMVASNLPDTKIKKPLPIVRPEWITASLKAGYLLSVHEFKLNVLMGDPKQKQLKPYRGHEVVEMPPEELFPTAPKQPVPSAQVTQPGLGPPAERPPLPPHSTAQVTQLGLGPPVQRHPQPPHPTAQVTQIGLGPPGQGPQPTPAWQSSAADVESQETSEGAGAAPLGLLSAGPGMEVLDAAAGGHAEDKQQQQQVIAAELRAACNGIKGRPRFSKDDLYFLIVIAAELRAACDVLKGGPRSSKDDPNFIESFYNASCAAGISKDEVGGTTAAAVGRPFKPSSAPATSTGLAPASKRAIMHIGMVAYSSHPQPPPPPLTLLLHPSRLFKPSSAPASSIGLAPASERAIMHIDMDCFFASAASVGRPELVGLPLVVCHSNHGGMAEISAANYEARKFGVRSGMYMKPAKQMCPALIVVPYEFERYTEISEQVYRILLRHTSCVQPVSCDEAFLDVTGLGNPEEIARNIRAAIQEKTECTASAALSIASATALSIASSIALTIAIASATALSIASATALSIASSIALTIAIASATALSIASSIALTIAIASATALSIASATALSIASSIALTIAIASATALSIASSIALTIAIASATALSIASSIALTIAIASATALSIASATALSIASSIALTIAIASATALSIASATALSIASSIALTIAIASATALSIASIGPNILTARLATKKAKPDGLYRIPREKVLEVMADLPVKELPGVGWSTGEKLKSLGITTVRQLWSQSKEMLQRQLGAKAGQSLWAHAHGQDDLEIQPPQARKSLIFHNNCPMFSPVFPQSLWAHAQGQDYRLWGASITLKIKQKAGNAPEPRKFLGHGICDSHSKSISFRQAIGAAADIAEAVKGLLRSLGIPPVDIRGLGIAVGKLEPPRHLPTSSADLLHKHQQQQQQLLAASSTATTSFPSATTSNATTPTRDRPRGLISPNATTPDKTPSQGQSYSPRPAGPINSGPGGQSGNQDVSPAGRPKRGPKMPHSAWAPMPAASGMLRGMRQPRPTDWAPIGNTLVSRQQLRIQDLMAPAQSRLPGPPGPPGPPNPIQPSAPYRHETRRQEEQASPVGTGGPADLMAPAPAPARHEAGHHEEEAVPVGTGGLLGTGGPADLMASAPAQAPARHEAGRQEEEVVPVGTGGPADLMAPAPARHEAGHQEEVATPVGTGRIVADGPAVLGGRTAASGSAPFGHGDGAGGSGAGAHHSPIHASQIDAAVLQELPLEIRREVEAQYGLKRRLALGRAPSAFPPKRANTNSSSIQAGSRVQPFASLAAGAKKKKGGQLPHFSSFPDSRWSSLGRDQAGPSGLGPPAAAPGSVYLDGIDLEVLAELPDSIRTEIMASFMPALPRSWAPKLIETKGTRGASAELRPNSLSRPQTAHPERPNLSEAPTRASGLPNPDGLHSGWHISTSEQQHVALSLGLGVSSAALGEDESLRQLYSWSGGKEARAKFMAAVEDHVASSKSSISPGKVASRSLSRALVQEHSGGKDARTSRQPAGKLPRLKFFIIVDQF
eukprot:gene21821-28847_t